MLLDLHVRGLGVLDDVQVTFAPGLNVITGETGAGKTLLVTSLALLTGARPPPGEASVEAVVAPGEALEALLDERGLDRGEDLVLARRTGARSRAWIAGTLVPVSALAEAGRALVEIHGQRAAFALARPQAQLDALDTFAGTWELRRRYEDALGRAARIDEELARITAEERDRARAVDVLSFQVAEIERARIDLDADDQIAGELARLEHTERLRELGAVAVDRGGSDGAAGGLGEAAKALDEASRFDGSVAALAGRAAALVGEASDVAADVRAWLESIDDDPARLDAVRERVALLSALRRKYGETLAEVVAFARDASARLADLEGAGARATELEAARREVGAELNAIAAQLTAERTQAAAALERSVREELPALSLATASFEVTLTPADGEHGRDRVDFVFGANASLPPGPLGKIASGGELSRVMLAVSLALARAHPVPSLVFDEADQGIGGQAALELARRLKRLGRTHQVLVVTHLAQIAAFADHHVVVDKTGGRVGVRAVAGEDRVAEISRMLAGLEDSARAQAHAQELLDLGRDPGGRRRKQGRVVAEAR